MKIEFSRDADNVIFASDLLNVHSECDGKGVSINNTNNDQKCAIITF